MQLILQMNSFIRKIKIRILMQESVAFHEDKRRVIQILQERKKNKQG